MKKKSESKSLGPVREEEFSPWNGITLNRCLVVAAIAALLSMGFQVLQDAVEDDLADVEFEAWAPPEQTDESSEPWFFETWFGSSEEEPVVDQPETSDIMESDLAEEAEPSNEDQLLTSVETEEELITEEPQHKEKTEARKDSETSAKQWGLKDKNKYMQAKVGKIRIASEDGSQRRGVFPFSMKPKEPSKTFADKEKSYKEKSYQKKEEKKHDHSKKQEFGKPYRKEKEEHHKYFKQDKGRREDKESKGYKQNYQEKRKYDSRHYG